MNKFWFCPSEDHGGGKRYSDSCVKAHLLKPIMENQNALGLLRNTLIWTGNNTRFKTGDSYYHILTNK